MSSRTYAVITSGKLTPAPVGGYHGFDVAACGRRAQRSRRDPYRLMDVYELPEMLRGLKAELFSFGATRRTRN